MFTTLGSLPRLQKGRWKRSQTYTCSFEKTTLLRRKTTSMVNLVNPHSPFPSFRSSLPSHQVPLNAPNPSSASGCAKTKMWRSSSVAPRSHEKKTLGTWVGRFCGLKVMHSFDCYFCGWVFFGGSSKFEGFLLPFLVMTIDYCLLGRDIPKNGRFIEWISESKCFQIQK